MIIKVRSVLEQNRTTHIFMFAAPIFVVRNTANRLEYVRIDETSLSLMNAHTKVRRRLSSSIRSLARKTLIPFVVRERTKRALQWTRIITAHSAHIMSDTPSRDQIRRDSRALKLNQIFYARLARQFQSRRLFLVEFTYNVDA